MVTQAGGLRNYNILLEGDGAKIKPMFLKGYVAPANFRPVVGHELTIENDTNLYRVVRVNPADNPSDKPVEYFVVVVGSKADRPRFTGFDGLGM